MASRQLFPPTPEPHRIDLADADLRLWPQAFAPEDADVLLLRLRTAIDWQAEDILIFGERQRVPRLVAWHGDPGTAYTYSGTRHEPLPWTDELRQVRERVERLTGLSFNSVLLNLYRDGRDGMGWHADDERELGRDPVVASVSLGATRRFRLRRRGGTTATSIDLAHGDLLLMAGATQQHYLHALPKTARPVGERVNLTFRHVLSPHELRHQRLDAALPNAAGDG